MKRVFNFATSELLYNNNSGEKSVKKVKPETNHHKFAIQIYIVCVCVMGLSKKETRFIHLKKHYMGRFFLGIIMTRETARILENKC